MESIDTNQPREYKKGGQIRRFTDRQIESLGVGADGWVRVEKPKKPAELTAKDGKVDPNKTAKVDPNAGQGEVSAGGTNAGDLAKDAVATDTPEATANISNLNKQDDGSDEHADTSESNGPNGQPADPQTSEQFSGLAEEGTQKGLDPSVKTARKKPAEGSTRKKAKPAES